jgi:hypothetical protein
MKIYQSIVYYYGKLLNTMLFVSICIRLWAQSKSRFEFYESISFRLINYKDISFHIKRII